MLKNSKSILCAALMTAAATSVTAAPAVKTGQPVTMPDSYTRFFPAAATASPLNPGDAVTNIKETVKRPALPSLKNVSKAPAQDGGNLYGYLYYYQNDALEQGFYRVNPESGQGTHLWTDFYTDWSVVMTGGWLREGRVCALSSMNFMGGVLAYIYGEYDFNTGEVLDMQQLRIAPDNLVNMYLTSAYCELDDRIYGYGYGPDGSTFCFKSADATDIDGSEIVRDVDYNNVCVALCYNSQENMFYGVTTKGMFVSVDHQGNQTEIFEVELPNLSATITGLAYDPATGVYVWNPFFSNQETGIYNIDAAAQTITKVATTPSGENYIYLINTLDNVAKDAPAIAKFDGFDFAGTALSGSVKYTLPGQTYEGNPITGDLDWEFRIDGEISLTGKAAPGSALTAEAKDLTNGKHTFALTTIKDGKRSLALVKTTWIGSDTPETPANVSLTNDKATWDAVTSSVHDGYVDYSALKYVVYLNDEMVGETQQTEIAITLPVERPFNSYKVYVEAVYDGKVSEKGVSNFVTCGVPLNVTADAPLHYRPEEVDLELFTYVNVDGDKNSDGSDRTWHFSDEMGFPAFSPGYEGDDWLFFPPINFDQTSKAYLYQMESGLRLNTDLTGTIGVYIGKEAKPEAMTQVILHPYSPQYMLGDFIKEYFAVPEAGTYYIGIHTITHAVSMHVSDMDISLTDRAADVPMAPTNLKLTADANAALEATATFTLPTHTANGKLLDPEKKITVNVHSYPCTPGNPVYGEQTECVTLEALPGTEQTVKVKTAQNYNTIVVECAIGENVGSSISELVYTGVVRPYIVQNLKAEVSEDNMSMKLTWTPPTEGEEPGLIGEDFFYTVWYYNGSWEFGDNVGWNTTEYTYTLKQGAEQQWVRLGIMAYNPAGQSDHVQAITEVIGTPYTLPMTEFFPNYTETYEPIMIQRPSAEYEGTYWQAEDPAVLAPIFANTSGVAYIGFTEDLTNVKSRLSLPKFSTKNMTDIKFSLEYFGGRGSNHTFAAQFSVLANTFGMQTPEAVADLPKGNMWITNEVTLPASIEGKEWAEVLLDAAFANDQEFAMFSAYSISGTTSVEDAVATEGTITATKGMLHVAGFKGESLVVADMAGRTVISVASLDDVNGFALAAGVYVVRAGERAMKVIIK